MSEIQQQEEKKKESEKEDVQEEKQKPPTKENNVKSVSFQEDESLKASKTSSSTRKPRIIEKSGKVKMGKANLKRDFTIFVAAIGFLIYVGICLKDMGKPSGEDKKRTIKDLMEVVNNKLEAQFRKRGGFSAPDCTMFLAKSSLPSASHGVFAGRDYAKGDIVFPSGNFLPVSLTEDTDILIQQYALKLKHHHLLANVDGNVFMKETDSKEEEVDNYILRASRDIKAGEEFFLPTDGHPRDEGAAVSRLFSTIPLPDHFAKADGIIRDEVSRFKTRRSHQKRPPSTRDIDSTLSLIHETAHRFSPIVASLLPKTKGELDKFIKSKGGVDSALDALKYKSTEALEMSTHCLSYVTQDPETSTIITTTKITKGSRVIPVPFLLLPLSDEACNAGLSETNGVCKIKDFESKSSCLGHRNLPFLVCLLLQASDIVLADASISEGDEAANVELQWSSWNAYNKDIKDLDVETVAKMPTTQYSFDAIALRHIEEGETLRLKVGPGTAVVPASIPDGLVPKKWLK